MEDICIRCDNPGTLGERTRLCHSCWWILSSWPVCRLTLKDEEKFSLFIEQERFTIKQLIDEYNQKFRIR